MFLAWRLRRQSLVQLKPLERGNLRKKMARKTECQILYRNSTLPKPLAYQRIMQYQTDSKAVRLRLKTGLDNWPTDRIFSLNPSKLIAWQNKKLTFLRGIKLNLECPQQKSHNVEGKIKIIWCSRDHENLKRKKRSYQRLTRGHRCWHWQRRILFIFVDVHFIYNVLVSSVQQSDSDTCVCVCIMKSFSYSNIYIYIYSFLDYFPFQTIGPSCLFIF